MEFYRAELPYYTCGFWVDDDNVIINSAPIMGWAVGRTLESFIKWAVSRRGKVQLMAEEKPERIVNAVIDTGIPLHGLFKPSKGSNVGEPPAGGGRPSQVDSD